MQTRRRGGRGRAWHAWGHRRRGAQGRVPGAEQEAGRGEAAGRCGAPRVGWWRGAADGGVDQELQLFFFLKWTSPSVLHPTVVVQPITVELNSTGIQTGNDGPSEPAVITCSSYWQVRADEHERCSMMMRWWGRGCPLLQIGTRE
ncbi:hypothetical protein C2845_PM12G19950 [Panicum miliaceum]|uniref:Uncharacterized protein n=1 Tax=Panicum miliaceum TaxID=4540 RepID=A0A3L6QFP5_PANMI|nr:hypothetical protein C2845_PM12G19950 [Panicum miliaceum]